MEAGIGQRVAGCEIVRAVEHDVEAANDRRRVRFVQPQSDRLDCDMRIDAGDRSFGALRLRPPDIARRMDDLAMQIGERNGIIVDDPERADAGACEILQRRRAEPARADDERARGFELVLAGAAQPMQDDLARVALDLFTREGHGSV